MILLSFNEALKKSDGKKNLLLGNGFSIDLFPDIFHYGSLFKNAEFNNATAIEDIFSELRTEDFELVVQALENAATILPCFRNKGEYDLQAITLQMKDYAKEIKLTLVNTIASRHPERPGSITEEQYEMCTNFLGYFLKDPNKGTLYTLNYDILLYWSLMHGLEKEKFTFNDGFSTNAEECPYYVVWNNPSHGTNVYYLHGALHLFDAGHELKKYSWRQTNIALIDQTREAISKNFFPLFVSEGTHEKKLNKIFHHAYLSKGLRSLSEISGSLFIHGMSFSDNDKHILTCIENNKNLKKLFVGLHDSPDLEHNRLIVDKANNLSQNRPPNKILDVSFYDSKTANVWRHYS